MTLFSLIWTFSVSSLFKPPGLWDKFDLDYILRKGDQLFEFTGKFTYLGIENLPQEYSTENVSVTVKFLENKTGEITAGEYFLSITEIVNSVQQIWTAALLIINNYILGLIWRTDSPYLFDSHNKDENGNLSSSGKAVLLKFDTLHSFKYYITLVYYSAYPMTLYFQFQFRKVYCTVNAKSPIKCLFKKEQLSAKLQVDLSFQKRKYHEIPEKNRRTAKRGYDNKEESAKQ